MSDIVYIVIRRSRSTFIGTWIDSVHSNEDAALRRCSAERSHDFNKGLWSVETKTVDPPFLEPA